MIGGAATHWQIQRVNANFFLKSTEDLDEKRTNEQILESCGKTEKESMPKQTYRDLV